MKTKKEISSGGIVYKNVSHSMFHVPRLWLITQHSQHKGWSFPKGLVGDNKQNEHMEQAALREVQEEGGVLAKIINNKPIEVHYKYKFEDILVEKTVYYFLMEYVSGDPKNHDWEVSEAKFTTENEVKKTLSFQTDKQAFKKIQKYL